jgi:hypothetical protein
VKFQKKKEEKYRGKSEGILEAESHKKCYIKAFGDN